MGEVFDVHSTSTIRVVKNICCRTKNFEKSGDYANAWSKNDDGQVNTGGPRVTVGEQMGPMGNMITKYVRTRVVRAARLKA